MEFNKIFAAVLIAGIIAMFSGFIAKNIIHSHEMEEDAVAIAGIEGASGGGPAKAAMPEPVLHLIATADVAQGEKLSKVCAACHSFDNGGPNGVGPNLWGIVGAKKAHLDGFAYSDGLAGMGGNWDYASLNKFLWKPKAYVDGTKMNFIGLKKPEDRAAVIAWLRTKAGSSAALPSDSQIAAEKAELEPEVSEAPAEGEAPAEEGAGEHHKG
ncbi:MAG: cytochrome c family protein [Alphaproteobacteria bacterium]|nr:cytochrome c family protein [Alphaproteobacteria bacterium]MCD8519835.1 cytochrome c family protein [Alphaproteobacteria bacterium]MCD8570372.1 cytochrome c family protein [Alphaproteobacteria bacterium]